MYLYYFPIISPFRRMWPFIWTNLNFLHPRMLCAKIGWSWTSGSGEEDFFKFSMYFYYFTIFSPLRREWPLIWTHLNPLHPSMICAKFGWNWLSGAWEEDGTVKSLQTDGPTDGRTDKRTTDNRRSENLTCTFSSGDLKSFQ